MGRRNPGPRDVDDRQAVRRLRAVVVMVAACTVVACAARPPRPRQRVAVSPRTPPRAPLVVGDRGWEYLKARLVADGVSRDRVERAYDDPSMEPFDGLPISPTRRGESHFMYRNFLREGGTQLARDCRIEHAAAFESAERRFGVPASVCAAIISVETHCGRNTGRSMILYRLSRLAMANEPQNLERSLQRCDGDPGDEQRVRERARYLEATFYPEVLATFEVARRMGIDPLSIRGSGSGAFGYPQFLPTSYLRHGVDGNGDGRVSLYDPADAAASCANYLVGHGWHRGLSFDEQRRVIWSYNHSDAYIDTVLTLARRIEESDGGSPDFPDAPR
jgi:membrane-bound lytic murein transglycosylase B